MMGGTPSLQLLEQQGEEVDGDFGGQFGIPFEEIPRRLDAIQGHFLQPHDLWIGICDLGGNRPGLLREVGSLNSRPHLCYQRRDLFHRLRRQQRIDRRPYIDVASHHLHALRSNHHSGDCDCYWDQHLHFHRELSACEFEMTGCA